MGVLLVGELPGVAGAQADSVIALLEISGE